jgi:DNA polymerase-3 subunit gamma/tau
MSYEVLARKLRPAGFDTLVGQEHVVRALTNSLDTDRLHHAYLFTGSRGVGKTTIARILAKCLNCEEGVGSSPCGQCSVCIAIKENRFIDLIEVDAASRTGVDDTRDLLDNAQYLPTIGRYKVYLIDEVHMLSAASFNALLKTLEEPPEHVKFLLATTDPKKVPVTVLSRCLQFQLKNLSRDAISIYLAQILETEGVEYEDDALSVIAKNAMGSMRDALSLADQAIAYGDGVVKTADVVTMLGVAGRDEVGAIVAALRRGSAEELMALSAELAERNADFVDVLSALIERLHELSVAFALDGNDSVFSAEELQLFYQIALMGFRDIHIVPDERSGFEMTMIRMLTFAPDSSATPRKPDNSGRSDAAEPTADVAKGRDDSDSRGNDSRSNDSRSNDSRSNDSRSNDSRSSDSRGLRGSEPGLDPKSERSPTEPPTESPSDLSSTNGVVAEKASATMQTNIDQSAWYGMVDALSIGGIARMIAEHSIIDIYEPPRVRLVLDENHEMLLSDGSELSLARALTEVVGEEVELTVAIGACEQELPAQRKARMNEERQQAAEAAIADDSTVKNLLADFGGQLDEVRPR